ncbi:MAG TPA: ATP phosphoribosyltransferase regulatory subunit, partial [Anaerolineales bacterium]|nr:ATP phosphoribosyltransferase regulatory subunit [Anaerolineales bacterium]
AQVKILVNNRRLVDSLLGEIGIPPETRPEIFRLIDRRDKMAADAWEANTREIGLSPNQYEELCALLENDENWKKSEELVRFFDTLEAMGLREYARYAPDVIRGLDYYTGTVFEARDFDGEFRAIFGGGRYDNLVGAVGGQPLPGIGFAMGDKVIELVLQKFQRRPAWAELNEAPVLVTVFGEEMLKASFTLAGELRQAGLKVAVYPVADKLTKQLKYADRIGSRVAVVLGPDELAKGVVQVKNLQTREQVDAARGEAGEVVRRMMQERK